MSIKMKVGHNEFTLRAEGGAIIKDMTKRVFGGQNRIERLPSPKDVPTYLAKLERLIDDKRAFFA